MYHACYATGNNETEHHFRKLSLKPGAKHHLLQTVDALGENGLRNKTEGQHTEIWILKRFLVYLNNLRKVHSQNAIKHETNLEFQH